MKRIIKWLVLGVMGVLFVGTLVFLYRKSQAAPVNYQVEAPARMTIVKKTVATGKVIPRREIEVKSQVSGVVDKLYVTAGQTVKKGTVIARISLRPNMLNVNTAEAQLLSARTSLQKQAADLERYKKLREQRLISELDFNQHATSFKLQQEAVEAAENTLLLLRTGQSRNASNVSNMIPATIDGMELVLNIGALEGKPFKATLEYISPKGVTDQGAIKFTIRAAVTLDKELFLRSNYSANADIVLDKREDVLGINEKNLIIDGKKTFVEVEKAPQQFEKREITTGLSDGINIEVVSGLGPDDKIKLR
jgi:HlyD family secretion protein